MLRLWKIKSVRVVVILAVLLAAYAVLGFVVAPKLVRSAILKDIPKAIAVTPAVGEIRINPFLLQITVDKFSLSGRGGELLLGFERLFVDLDVSSIWHRAYSFATIELVAPVVNASLAADGSLNLAQLKPRLAAKPDEQGGKLPAIRIGSFRILRGTVSYQDHSDPDVFSLRLEPINVELRDFTTGQEGGRFKLTAASKLGEKVEWHGHVSVDPLESDGEFHVAGLKVHTLWEYLEDKLSFVANSGIIDLGATYRFVGKGPAGGAPNVQVELQQFTVSDLAVRPKDADVDWISLPLLTATDATIDVAKHRARIDGVSVSGLKVLTWLESDGSLNLMKLAAAARPPAGAAAPVTTPPATPAAATPAAPTVATPAAPTAAPTVAPTAENAS